MFTFFRGLLLCIKFCFIFSVHPAWHTYVPVAYSRGPPPPSGTPRHKTRRVPDDELYDYTRDPWETTNFAKVANYSHAVAELRAVLRKQYAA